MSERDDLLKREDELFDVLAGCIIGFLKAYEVLKSKDEDKCREAIESTKSCLDNARRVRDELKEIRHKLDRLDEDEEDGK